MTQPNPPEIVAEAIKALAPFHVADRATVTALLAMWSRRGELTASDIHAILGHYGHPPVDRAVQLREEMAERYAQAFTAVGLPTELIPPRIYEDIADRMPPGVEPPADMVRQFPAELGGRCGEDAPQACRDGAR